MKLSTRKPLVFFLLVFLSFLGIQKARASHAMGADISYKCIDTVNHVYTVHVTFYRNCGGIDFPDNINLLVEAPSCGQSFDVTLLRLPAPPQTNGGKPYEVTPLCPSAIPKSECDANGGGLYQGVMGVPYEATVTLPETCVDWTFSISIGARNDQVTNLLDPGVQNLYVKATLNNVLAQKDDSPDFTTIPTPYFCINGTSSYNHGAVDADGDSLVYTMVNPLGIGGVPIGYVFPFSPTNPMSTSGPFLFDNSTGQMNFSANAVQNAAIAILVEEYRNGKLIGSTMRDIQFVSLNVQGCGDPTPSFPGIKQSSVSGGFFIGPNLLEACPGTTITFTTGARSINGDSLFIESNIAQSIPGAQFTVTRVSKDSASAVFNWTTTINDTGQHSFVVIIKDNHCPLTNTQANAITINVLKGTNAGPDAFYCPSGGAVQLKATGGTQFTWSPKLGLSDSTIANPLASPPRSIMYVVTSNLTSTCKNKDTIFVFRVADFTYKLTASKDTLCLNDISALNVEAGATSGPYTYTWTPATGLSSASIPDPYAQPLQTTNYTVAIHSEKTGCTRKATKNLVVRGVGPHVTLAADRNQVCVGDTIQLTSFVSTVQCGLNPSPCAGNSSIKTLGTDTLHTFVTPTPYQGSYMAGRFQMLFKADELRALGLQPGSIRSIAFDIYRRDNSLSYPNFNIRMGCTSVNRITGFITGLSTVYNTNNFVPSGTGWNTHVFNTAYNWDGISNLVVEVCFTNNQTEYTDDIVNASTTDYTSVVFAQADNQIGCTLNTGQASIVVSANRPNVRFDYCPAPAPQITHSWNPASGLIVPDSLSPKIVLDRNETLVLTVADSSCEGSAAVALRIDTSFSVTVGPDVTVCNGEPVQLNATLTGVLPTQSLTCGVNGTLCSTTPENKTINLAGAAISGHTPFPGDTGGNYANARTQILYRSTYLGNAGIKKGTISSIGLNISQKNSTEAYRNLNIKIGCTNKVQLDDNNWEPTGQVFNAATYTMNAGWNDFALQNTFDWDGVSNIVVEICWNNPDSLPQRGADLVSMQNTNYISFHTGASKTTAGCNIAVPTNRYYAELLPLRMTICPPPLLPVTYKWTPSSVVPDTISNPVVTAAQPTTYRVTTRFGNQCAKADELVVTPVTLTATIINDTTICNGEQVQLNAAGGGNIFSWEGGPLSCTTCPDPVATPDATTTYTVSITDSVSKCTASATITIVVVPKVDITPPIINDTTDGSLVALAFTTTGGTGSYNYNWTPIQFLDRIDTSTAMANPQEDIQYTIKATSGPCTDSAIAIITVIKLDSVVVPTGFTPNDDGHNDKFFPVFQKGNSSVKAFRIYNRFGQLVHDGGTEWDGKFKGAEQPAGTYIYYLAVQLPSKEERHYQGSVTLIR